MQREKRRGPNREPEGEREGEREIQAPSRKRMISETTREKQAEMDAQIADEKTSRRASLMERVERKKGVFLLN